MNVTDNIINPGMPKKVNFNQNLHLENGDILPSFELMIETYGKLNSNHSNAILICHALAGDHHVAGKYSQDDKYPGWWDNMIGPNKPIDTNKFFVVGVNNLGGCRGSSGPNSINPKTNEIYGASFPIVTVEDWVKSQVILSDYLEIEKWAAIVGGSLGGMQVLQWSIDFPQRLRHAIIIASAPKLSTQNIAFNDIARQAIIHDPSFCNGNYIKHKSIPKYGLKIARMMGHVTYLGEKGLGIKFGRELKKGDYLFDYTENFEIESYLRHQGDKFANYFDANTYLLMTKALDYFDPAKKYQNSLLKTLSHVMAKFLIISFSSDWRFSPARSEEIVEALIKNNKHVKYIEVESNNGHDAFLLEDRDYIEAMLIYFKQVYKESI